jgi:hypothetical protein
MSKWVIGAIIIYLILVGIGAYFIAQELSNALRPENVGHYFKTLKEAAK